MAAAGIGPEAVALGLKKEGHGRVMSLDDDEEEDEEEEEDGTGCEEEEEEEDEEESEVDSEELRRRRASQMVREENVLMIYVENIANLPCKGVFKFKFSKYLTELMPSRKFIGQEIEFVLPHTSRGVRFSHDGHTLLLSFYTLRSHNPSYTCKMDVGEMLNEKPEVRGWFVMTPYRRQSLQKRSAVKNRPNGMVRSASVESTEEMGQTGMEHPEEHPFQVLLRISRFHTTEDFLDATHSKAVWDEIRSNGEWQPETVSEVGFSTSLGHGPPGHGRAVSESGVEEHHPGGALHPTSASGTAPLLAPVNGEACAAPLFSALVPRKESTLSLDAMHMGEGSEVDSASHPANAHSSVPKSAHLTVPSPNGSDVDEHSECSMHSTQLRPRRSSLKLPAENSAAVQSSSTSHASGHTFHVDRAQEDQYRLIDLLKSYPWELRRSKKWCDPSGTCFPRLTRRQEILAQVKAAQQQEALATGAEEPSTSSAKVRSGLQMLSQEDSIRTAREKTRGVTLELPFSSGVMHSTMGLPSSSIGRFPSWKLVVRYSGDRSPEHRVRGRVRVSTLGPIPFSASSRHVDTMSLPAEGEDGICELLLPGDLTGLSVDMEVFYAGNVEWRSQHFRDKKYQGSSIQLKEIFLEGCNESFSGKSGDTSSCLLL